MHFLSQFAFSPAARAASFLPFAAQLHPSSVAPASFFAVLASFFTELASSFFLATACSPSFYLSILAKTDKLPISAIYLLFVF